MTKKLQLTLTLSGVLLLSGALYSLGYLPDWVREPLLIVLGVYALGSHGAAELKEPR